MSAALIHGWIADYNEQGMEGDYWLTVQDERFVHEGQWDRAGMHILKPGDRLTILAPDGGTLWSGVYGTPLPVLERLAQGLTGDRRWHPDGVSVETWEGWFRRRPPLRATLTPAP